MARPIRRLAACAASRVVPSLVSARWMAAGLALVLQAGCAPGGNLPPLPAVSAGAYQLGAGDQIRAITFGEPQMTGEFRVSDDGTVQMPLIGGVQASGLTVGALQESLAGEMRRKGILLRPSVSVEIVAYRPIFVLGEVNHPGRYPYEPGMTLLSAVADAGGFTSRATQSVASVVRTTRAGAGAQTIEGRAGRDAVLAPGDVVTVFERNF